MGLRKDIWHSAIIKAPIAEIVGRGSLAGLECFWLPDAGNYRFRADPFGLWQNDKLYLFCEYFDYRYKKGAIELFIYDKSYRLLDRRIILSEPWHLSYPYLIEAEGEIWMLPEAWHSGQLTLYRAVEFPYRWEAASIINPGCIPIDATPVYYDGLWWLFYSPAWPLKFRKTRLEVAWAKTLSGPWHPHPHNPIHRGLSGSRAGGTPFIMGSKLVLPVQDCTQTYGKAIRPLYFDCLSRDKVETRLGAPLGEPSGFPYPIDGVHTLSAAGEVTLIDVKHRARSAKGALIALQYEVRKRLF
ncbi:MAG: formyl transferase [Zymomonas mobilis subsp. pomaceae]|uniref:Putative formyl transferase n=1 Tax=Zymomonas mobilis subsp. pomaceae (strain ATCC 29192 / DSM 22645 / JCM 10191 / CCUG 17912 / NBRC 13757 / NCIMB 11200 / NRRL B-4491 / Barker I) TaxID=579138 RepID=F8EV54_ZYMMT|nr:hypothetical protein [Zymomonas mobilis]AEI38272.1 putative formyl transferase [Zymomonas mobilis subsp. pomaceae ATCC 29192]MDX5947961.1 formyl transferase [Zymomonas mobilis subsp. pomaceae]GEB89290.1 hypothetical protein ZMO02_09270 [Zymomonas mobilis subsp. pomaceae]